MGTRDGVPMGDWFRGLELLLWAGVVGLEMAGISHRAFTNTTSIIHPGTEA